MEQNFGNRIGKLLNMRNMTQRELADKTHITEASVSRYIHGNRIPKATIISDMAAVLETTADYLLHGGSGNKFDIEYHEIKRLIKKNASFMSKDQKINIIAELL